MTSKKLHYLQGPQCEDETVQRLIGSAAQWHHQGLQCPPSLGSCWIVFNVRSGLHILPPLTFSAPERGVSSIISFVQMEKLRLSRVPCLNCIAQPIRGGIPVVPGISSSLHHMCIEEKKKDLALPWRSSPNFGFLFPLLFLEIKSGPHAC